MIDHSNLWVVVSKLFLQFEPYLQICWEWPSIWMMGWSLTTGLRPPHRQKSKSSSSMLLHPMEQTTGEYHIDGMVICSSRTCAFSSARRASSSTACSHLTQLVVQICHETKVEWDDRDGQTYVTIWSRENNAQVLALWLLPGGKKGWCLLSENSRYPVIYLYLQTMSNGEGFRVER